MSVQKSLHRTEGWFLSWYHHVPLDPNPSALAIFLEQELPAEPVLPLLLLLLQTLHNCKPQLLLLVSCVYPTDHGKKGEEEGVYNRKIINSDMPSLSARQSLAAQERPRWLLCARRVIASCGELSCCERLQQVPFPPPAQGIQSKSGS